MVNDLVTLTFTFELKIAFWTLLPLGIMFHKHTLIFLFYQSFVCIFAQDWFKINEQFVIFLFYQSFVRIFAQDWFKINECFVIFHYSYLPSKHEVSCYNCLASESRSIKSTDKSMGDLFKPELAVPTRMGCTASRSHCALHMLGKGVIMCTVYIVQTTVWGICSNQS